MSETTLTPAADGAAPPPAPSLLARWRSQIAYQGLSLAAVCALVACCCWSATS